MAALRRMRPRDRGTIVQVGSALAYRGIPLQAPYCGAKHALRGFTESLRAELLHDGSNVRMTMVQLPGAEHAAVHLEPREAAAQAAAGAADLPARGRRRRDRLGRAPPAARAVVGWPTVKAIVGNAVAPGSSTATWPATGYDAQQTDEPLDPGRPDNLFEPVAGDQRRARALRRPRAQPQLPAVRAHAPAARRRHRRRVGARDRRDDPQALTTPQRKVTCRELRKIACCVRVIVSWFAAGSIRLPSSFVCHRPQQCPSSWAISRPRTRSTVT